MSAKDELLRLLDEFEYECFMLRVEATETKAKDKDVRDAYERIREESARAIASWNSRAERTCEIVEWYQAKDRHEIGNNRVRFSCGHFGICHYKFCAECGAKVVKR